MAYTMAARITSLVERTQDAYSFPTYGEREWRRAIRLLIDRGEDVLIYMDKPKNKVSAAYIAQLVQETFNDGGTNIGTPVGGPDTGADLAGACEGEDIADLIDLAIAIRDDVPEVSKTDSRLALKVLTDRAAAILARIEARAK